MDWAEFSKAQTERMSVLADGSRANFQFVFGRKR